jgi:glycosyltransferase involved in cell wall biosynthesis/ribosomal protein S18 acetylase RimI-like enzyme
MSGPRLLHIATTDMSLALLLGPQLRAFADAGYEVHTASATGAWAAELAELGVTHHPLRHATRASAPLRDAAALCEIYRLIRRIKPVIVHTHNPKPGIYGRIAARLARTPVVVNTVHGLYAQPGDAWRRKAPVYLAERVAATCSDLELVQNVEDLGTLATLRVPHRRLRLLGNGVDLCRFNIPARDRATRDRIRAECGVGPHEVMVLAVGRLVAEKGYRELFEAARGLPEHGARLVVAGGSEPDKADGLTRRDLDDAAAAGVVLLGHRSDVADLYAAADIFVLASHREGFPRSAMEASARGLPIVGTDIRGTRQVVGHEQTGLLVPVHDASALRTAIVRLADDAGTRDRMGQAAAERARVEFDDRRVIRRTLAGYGARLAERGHTGPVTASIGAVRLVDPTTAPDELDRISWATAGLHRSVLAESFLAALGDRFLARLYRRIVTSPGSFLLVVEDHGELQGFCAGTAGTGVLYREFVRRDGILAALGAAPRIARNPRRVLETWSYGRTQETTPRPAAELLALGVRPDARGNGLASALVEACQGEFARRGVTSSGVTVATHNTSAQGVYARHGYRTVGEVAVHRDSTSLTMVRS